MPEPYKPNGSDVTYTVPSLDDPADGPQAFRDFADSIPASLSPVVPVHNKATDYTLGVDDEGALVGFDCTAKDLNVTVPVHGKVDFPIGSVIVVGCVGTNRKSSLTIIAEEGVTLRDLGVRKVAWSRMAALIKIDQDSWIINAGSGGGTPTSIPTPPKLESVSPGIMQATVFWKEPSDDGGSPITAYLVEISKDDKTWNTGASASATARVTAVPVDEPGRYYLRVRAANAFGVSDPSAVLPVDIAPPIPDAPVVRHSATGQWTITNYVSTLLYTAQTTAGTATVTGDKVDCTGPDSVTTLSVQVIKDGPRKDIYLERKKYTYHQDCHVAEEYHTDCPNCGGCCPGGWNCEDYGAQGVWCKRYECVDVKNPTPAGYQDEFGEWFRSFYPSMADWSDGDGKSSKTVEEREAERAKEDQP